MNLCRIRVITGKVVPCNEGVVVYMSIDMFNLTTYASVDRRYLEEMANIREDKLGRSLYQFYCQLDYGCVMWKPHKFGPETNDKIPYTKVDINPKYFNNFNMFYDVLVGLFSESEIISQDSFHISRIDLKSDIENLPIDVVLSRLYAMGYRRDSVTIIKGSTIYIGSNPKIRIYDKTKEISARLKKGGDVSESEMEILKSGKQITRFEIQIRSYKGTLKDVAADPVSLASYFDRIHFYNFEDDGKIASIGGLQLLFSKIPRKNRAVFEEFKDNNLETQVRTEYITSVREWFEGKDEGLEGVPF